MNNWEEVYKTANRFEAYVVEGLLKDNDIPAVVLEQQDSNYKFGEFKVMVQGKNVISAKQLLSNTDINYNN